MCTNVILTGFMGTGKTAVGRLLAEALGYAFIDTDDMVQEISGRSIPEIFAESGEAAFRQFEREVVLELAGSEGLVIATGGGLMLDEVNSAVLEKNGRIFCLTAGVDEIIRRLAADGSEKRPLLAGPNPRETAAELLAARQKAYGRFRQIDTEGKKPADVVEIIMEALRNGKNG